MRKVIDENKSKIILTIQGEKSLKNGGEEEVIRG